MEISFEILTQVPGLNCEELRIIDSLPAIARWEFLYYFKQKYPEYEKPIRVFEYLWHQRSKKLWAEKQYTEFLSKNGINNLSEWQMST